MNNGFDDVRRNMEEVLRNQMRKKAESAMDEVGHYLANYAKDNHLWTPRTGDTDRSTVGGLYESTAEYVRAVLSAGMTYDVFLELAREGRWAWLNPAVEANQSAINSIIVRHMSL